MPIYAVVEKITEKKKSQSHQVTGYTEDIAWAKKQADFLFNQKLHKYKDKIEMLTIRDNGCMMRLCLTDGSTHEVLIQKYSESYFYKK